MVVETRDDDGRIVTINAVMLPDGQARLTIIVQTANRSRTILTTAMTLTNTDATILSVGLDA